MIDIKILLNAIGLGFGIAGVTLMTWSTMRDPFFRRKNNNGASMDPMLKEDPLRPDPIKKTSNLWRIRTGFTVLGLGFVFQFVALFL